MDDNLLKQEKVAAAGMRRPWLWVLGVCIWPALLVLALMQMRCVPFPGFHILYPAAAVMGSLVCLMTKVAALRRDGGKVLIRGQFKTVSHSSAIGNVIGLTIASALVAFIASYVLLGDLVLFTSHTRHDYDATVMGVWRGPKQKCKNPDGFVDETLQTGVSECAPDSEDIHPGVRVHVETLTGPFGVKFLSVRRAASN